MARDLNAARALVKQAAQAILTDLAQGTIGRTTPVHARDSGTMAETSVALPPNSDAQPGRILYPRDKYGRRVKRELEAIDATDDLTSRAVVPATYAWDQERVNPALGPAADQAGGDLATSVARHQL